MIDIKNGLCVAILLVVAAPVVHALQTYPTPMVAAEALIDGIARHDGDAVKAALGTDYLKYIPADGRDPEDITNFLAAWARHREIVSKGDALAFLGVGTNGWTLPIPIVKVTDGWQFDVHAAPEEMRVRRIGRNELAVIQVALAYTDAQEDYHAQDWDGDGVLEFAQHALSTEDKRDGLYWASLPDEPESPLGPQFADAKPGQPYHGYVYRILTAQGDHAPGGARNYIRDGHMTEGYALIAWPEKYNDTGVMSFIVNRDGIVYQKDLGPQSATAARALHSYDPDDSWNKAETEP